MLLLGEASHPLCDSRKVFSSLGDFKGDVFISCVIQERCFLSLIFLIIDCKFGLF